MEQKTVPLYAFGPYRIRISERQLLRHGVPVALPPKVFDVLCALVENHGHVVSKDELMTRVWIDTFVEDANLTVNISALRKALGKDPNGSQYVETIPKYGYRFAAQVVELADDDDQRSGEIQSARPVPPEELPLLRQRDAKDVKPGTAHATQRLASEAHTSPYPIRFVLGAGLALALVIVGCFALWRLSGNGRMGAAPSPIDSIAVLPFDNAVREADGEYLSDGITENLIDRFSNLSGLKVASRSSSFRYKGEVQDTAKIGKELGVSAVLTGSVKQLGDQLVIAVRLDDARTDQHIWGKQYLRKLGDILTVQDEIAQDVTTNLRLQLNGADEQKLAKNYTQSSEAYRLYLKGNYVWNKHTQEDLQKAIHYYEQALEIDPSFALAYTGLAGSYGLLGNGFLPPKDNFPIAREHALKALAIDDDLAEAHGAMGAIRLLYDWDWAGQEAEFKRAQALAPNYGAAHQLYAAYLETAGRFDEARLEASRAQQIDPLSAMFGTELGIISYFDGRYDEAISQCEETLRLEPGYADAYQYLGQSYEQKKMYGEAIQTFETGMRQTDREPALLASLGHTYAVAGDHRKALAIVGELREVSKNRYINPYLYAVVYAGLGDREHTLASLEEAFQQRASSMIWLRVEPQFKALKDDRRFQDLLTRVGI